MTDRERSTPQEREEDVEEVVEARRDLRHRRHRRPARRDRFGARGERRGVRQELRPEGRRVSERFERTLPLGAPLPGSSFVDLLGSVGATPRWDIPAGVAGTIQAPEGTTVLALRYAGGVVMAGDRRPPRAIWSLTATFRRCSRPTVIRRGHRRTAGLAIEMVRLFQVELEHYEKIEGTRSHPRGQGELPRQPGAQASSRWRSRAWSSFQCSPVTTS
jgi:hypothetical protein